MHQRSMCESRRELMGWGEYRGMADRVLSFMGDGHMEWEEQAQRNGMVGPVGSDKMGQNTVVETEEHQLDGEEKAGGCSSVAPGQRRK